VDTIAERLGAMMPDLEKGDLHLPYQFGVERSSDPDATNALPVMRKSDRPFPVRGAAGTAGPSPLAMQITNPPLGKNVPGAAGSWLQSAEQYAHGMPPRQLAAAAGGVGAIVVLAIVGLAAAFTRSTGGGSQAPATANPTAGRAATTAAPDTPAVAASNVPNADESAEVPTYAVDSLPVAGRGPPSKGNGRLSIVATPGWCSISVDGQRRGVTPLNAFELPAGSHRVECVPPTGKTRTSNVNVAEGTATNFKFALDE